jgi:NAD(P)-dependent dehydrogenase (short-subunit alcohol dehydrogenase family)
MDVYRDRTAIVTGAASGIGRAVCEGLVRHGARVVLADMDEELLKETAASLAGMGGEVKAATLDVRDFEAVKRLVDDTVAERGRLDYIFNNAGIAVAGEAHEHPISAWRRVVDTNLYGVINGVAAAYPVMVKQGSGHIVNTASTAGLVPIAGEISYVTSKFGVVGLSGALRMEGAMHGVKVSVICPGFIRTPIYDNAELINMDREAALRMIPKGYDVDKAARIILADVARNRAVIVPPRPARAIWWLHRLAPGLVYRIFLHYSGVFLRKVRAPF